jgi:hypothetical protein
MKRKGLIMRHLVLPSLAGLALAACQPGVAPPPDMTATCRAEALLPLVGEPRGALDGQDIDAPTRILPPGSAMTMDHRPDRLNVELDEAGQITRIWCG